LFLTAVVLPAAVLPGCAVGPDVTPTYEALERGLRWQCQGSPDADLCARQKYLDLQERRRRQLLLNECAVSYGWTPRERRSDECRNALEPQTIECRHVFGTMTCTIAEDRS